MKVIDHVIIPPELKELRFCCDLSKCHGGCCVDGDAGAPLTEEEISLLEDYSDRILPFMEPAGREIVERNGVFDWDMDGQYVTPLVADRECAFVVFKEGTAFCAIEQAWADGLVPLRKPESCHLYPLRLQNLENGMVKMVYHRWPICDPALKHGREQGVLLEDFLASALTQKFGPDWYQRLKQIPR